MGRKLVQGKLTPEVRLAYGVKRCPRCEVVHNLSDFHRDRGRADGREAICKICANIRDRARQSRPERKAQHVAAARRYRRKYGPAYNAVERIRRQTPEYRATKRKIWQRNSDRYKEQYRRAREAGFSRQDAGRMRQMSASRFNAKMEAINGTETHSTECS